MTTNQAFSTYIIAEPCVGVKDATCVEVCPVDCIHSEPEEDQYYIDPAVCIACEQCVLVCPVDAIYLDNNVPPQWESYTERNRAFYERTKEVPSTVPAEKAERMVQAAQSRAMELGAAVTVALVDVSGALVTSGSMDGSNAEVESAALDKAYTAAMFQKPTHQIGRNPSQNAPSGADAGRMVAGMGGYPILDGPVLVGAIAVSGGSPEQDQACCQAALAALRNLG